MNCLLITGLSTLITLFIEFWEHITGDRQFYHRLAKAFGEVVEEDNIDGSQLIMAKIEEIAHEIEEMGGL